MSKTPRSITEQMQLHINRGMTFLDEGAAIDTLKSINYYRLKGYWWDMQTDRTLHTFHPDTVFETVLERYNFDRHLRLILFDAIERIEIALKTKMIYHLSLSYGALWYRQTELVEDSELHRLNLEHLEREFRCSNEIFIVNHKRRFPAEEPEAWKILEIW